MPELPMPQMLYLTGAIIAFAAFGLTLLGVSVYTTFSKTPTEAAKKPAKRAPKPTTAHVAHG